MFVANLQWLTILAQAKEPAGWQDLLLGSPMIPMVLTLAVFFFLFTRADLKKQQSQRKMLEELKKNDMVVTAGGICGTIVNANAGSKYITIRVDDTNNTRLRILRSAVTSIDAGEETPTSDAK